MIEADRLRGERLRAWCAAVEGKPARFDECSVWPLEWVVGETGIETDWPVFASVEDMNAYLAAQGGLLAVWEAKARELNLAEVHPMDVPPIGSVGVIETRQQGHIGCIFSHAQIGCIRGTEGFRMIGLRRHTIVKAWSV